MSFPDGLKFRLLYDEGVELLAPDMGVQFLHGEAWCDLDGAVVNGRDVAGAAIRKDVNGAEGQQLIFGIHFIEDEMCIRDRYSPCPSAFRPTRHPDSQFLSHHLVALGVQNRLHGGRCGRVAKGSVTDATPLIGRIFAAPSFCRFGI